MPELREPVPGSGVCKHHQTHGWQPFCRMFPVHFQSEIILAVRFTNKDYWNGVFSRHAPLQPLAA